MKRKGLCGYHETLALLGTCGIGILRAYPNNPVVTRPSEKVEAEEAGPKCPEAWCAPR